MNYSVFKRTMVVVLMVGTTFVSLYSMRPAVRVFSRVSGPVRATWQATTPARQFVRSRPWTCLAMGLGVAGFITDRIRADRFEFIDVSRPARPYALAETPEGLCPENFSKGRSMGYDGDIADLATSLSELQLQRDYPMDCAGDRGVLDHPTISNVKPTADEHLDLVLMTNFWLIDPKARKKVLSFAKKLSRDEAHEQKQGNVVGYHGTHRGGLMLMNTVLSQVLNEYPDDKNIKLRDDKIMARAAHYDSSDDYKKALEKTLVLGPEKMMIGPGGAKCKLPGEWVFPDGSKNDDENPRIRDYYLPCNFTVFGQSLWLKHGTKESSAEFIVRPLSCMTRAIGNADHMTSMMGILVIGDLVSRVIDKPSLLKNFARDFDKNIDDSVKRLGVRNFMHELFRAKGIETHYDKYAEELAEFERVAAYGLVQISMPEACADRWAYISSRMGEYASGFDSAGRLLYRDNYRKLPETVSRLLKQDYCGDYQMRLFLPGIVKNPDVRMKFYVLAEPRATEEMLRRMHEIAHEIKAAEHRTC